MHLRSIALKGFKSFPQRTRLDFAPGVSVIVGPNGSGKSNITDAVLWALGEQSPLAIRGQTMKDVIFAGGHGLNGSSAAEVEVVIDNEPSEASGVSPAKPGERALPSEFSEISIVRRLDRDGEGEYRLNGARCRLVDVLEVLSDSGLGKEMHSVVSQGKVEAIVLSRPRDRRLLIEEAAGLGKHRKRRRRAQLKLERTQENLSRALDVEREARSRLRPLKRQAEAAELHERLERQSLEARLELASEGVREARALLGAAESRAAAARAERDEAERLLDAVARRREAAEEAFAEQSRGREELQARLFAARSAAERIGMRLDRARETASVAAERRVRRLSQLELLDREAGQGAAAAKVAGRIAELESELERLDATREERLRAELASLEAELRGAGSRRAELEAAAERARAALKEAERAADEARATRRQAEREADAARRRAAEAGAELAAVNQFLRAASGALGGARALAEGLRVSPGYELALAAALGPRLAAGVVGDRAAGERLLDAAGDAGGTALVAGGRSERLAGPSGVSERGERAPAAAEPHGSAPAGAELLLDRVDPEPALAALAERLLAGVLVVDSFDDLPDGFRGVAVTRGGRLFHGATGELSQAPAGGSDRLLEARNRRQELAAASERAARGEQEAGAALARAAEAVSKADQRRDDSDVALRRALREVEQAGEEAARAEWLIARRRETPDEGPDAVRRAELGSELRAERRLAERLELERAERVRAIERLHGAIERDAALAASAGRAATALEAAAAAVAARCDALDAELDAGAAAGRETAATLRACAHEEADLQGRLRHAGEAVTAAEVAAQQVRDAAADSERELRAIASRLGLEPEAAPAPLPSERREELEARVERLARRREQLGPVNPLARREYEEAVAHAEELEGQRRDLEAALAELEGLIRETDRRIRESFEQTFEAAARNFEDVVGHLFPGGRGRLRLVQPDGPRPVLGGEPEDEDQAAATDEAEEPEAGVEVEVTPAGKATKRLSLLSGGEKSLVALAFMFAVFLARPCPFYILDEVEAALDDVNIDRFLQLVRRYSDRAQFIVVTHQKRTMDAADRLYGVTMGGDGVSRVVSRRLRGADEVAGSERAA
jgi:chromosome segregation protein